MQAQAHTKLLSLLCTLLSGGGGGGIGQHVLAAAAAANLLGRPASGLPLSLSVTLDQKNKSERGSHCIEGAPGGSNQQQ